MKGSLLSRKPLINSIAFDSVSWSFLYKVLEYFGFGDSLILWIKLFNNNASLSVNLGGHLSSSFNIGQGCRQGDPVSPFYLACTKVQEELLQSPRRRR